MSKILKRVFGVVLAFVLMMSVCSVAFAAVENSDLDTLAALGIADGAYGSAIADSPDGADEKVIEFAGSSTRANVELAYTWEEGVTYTILFKYWMDAAHTANGFDMYYGVAANGGKTSANVSFYTDKSYAGDGMWHTTSAVFTYKVPTANTTYTNIYLTCWADTLKIYVKDIEILNGSYSFGNISGDLSHLIGDDGSVKPVASSDYTYGSGGALSQSKVGDDGNYVVVPSSNGNATKTGVTAVQYVKLHNHWSDTSSSKITLQPGNTYTVALNYKVLKLGTNGTANLGIGYNVKDGSGSDGASGSSWYNCNVLTVTGPMTETTEDYSTLYYTFDYNLASPADLVLTVNAAGAEYAIGDYTVARKTTGFDEASVITYNDNGNIWVYADYVGNKITAEADNGYLGEESKGWVADAQLSGEVVTYVPAGDPHLYAKYNTVVIDNFNMSYGLRSQYDHYNCATLYRGASMMLTTSTVGVMLPAYDDVGTNDSVDGNYAWYQFEKDKEYSIVIEMTDVTTGTAGNSIAITPATAGGSAGKRDQNGQKTIQKIAADSAYDELAIGATFTWTTTSGYTGAVIRGTADHTYEEDPEGNKVKVADSTMTMYIQKIIITKITDEPAAAITAVSIRSATDTQTAGIRFRGRILGDNVRNADEVGFVIVPTSALGEMTVEEYMNTDGSAAVKGVNYNATEQLNVVYDEIIGNNGLDNAFYDYQVILTGLTSLTDSTVDLRGLDLTVAFYMTTSTGTVYLDTYATSYNAVAEASK